MDWILDLPPEPFWEHDPVLAAHVHAAKAEACHEKLSLLYVAMTRAKRAMYAITKPAGSSSSANFPRILADTLGEDTGTIAVGSLKLPGAWSAGPADWHRDLPPPRPVDEPAGLGLLDSATRVVRRISRRPSAEKTGSVAAAALFAPAEAADYGLAVHAAFARVTWGADGTAALAGLSGAAAEEARACLASPELAPVWARPEAEAAEAWIERSFEVVIGETWLSGKFDRVVIARDGGGRAVRATVFDFKTDRFPPEADLRAEGERHAGQLRLYQRAVAVLTGLPAAAVQAQVVFTEPRRRVILPPLPA